MLIYKTETRPGLVALYEIRPGNGQGPFLQLRSPHTGVHRCNVHAISSYRGNRPTNTQTNIQDRLQCIAPQPLLAMADEYC